MIGGSECNRQRPSILIAVAAGICACLLLGTVTSKLGAESQHIKLTPPLQQSARASQSAAENAGVLQLCSRRSSLNTTAAAAKRLYQQFLLDDAVRRHGNLQHVKWAGFSGPWLENTFRDHFAALFAAGQDVGDRVYLPIMWFDCLFGCSQEQKADLTGYFRTLRPEYRYVTVYTMDKGLIFGNLKLPPGLDLLVFSQGATMRGMRTVPLPLLKKVLQPKGLPKDIHISFVGNAKSHALRQEMVHQLRSQGYLFAEATTNRTVQLVERSVFTLAPRGHSSGSFRMYEALQLGSIPVFIWDTDPLLPFQELLDWNEIAITVHRKDIHLIPHLIAAFDVQRAQRRLAELKHVWTYDFSEQYMIDRLRREHCHPAPVSTWNDLWGTE